MLPPKLPGHISRVTTAQSHQFSAPSDVKIKAPPALPSESTDYFPCTPDIFKKNLNYSVTIEALHNHRILFQKFKNILFFIQTVLNCGHVSHCENRLSLSCTVKYYIMVSERDDTPPNRYLHYGTQSPVTYNRSLATCEQRLQQRQSEAAQMRAFRAQCRQQ